VDDEGWEPSFAPGVSAAVLVGLVAHPEGPSIILTQRTEHLDNHPGEVGLPGGRVEAADAGPAQAALREAFEEVGLAPDRVEILGCLPLYNTASGFRVYPFVGWIEPPVELTADPNEVAEIFQVPLSLALDPANYRRDSLRVAGESHSFYVLPYPGRHIWGATAGMLLSLARIVGS
jgi:8-oxo-dGTP pyrophosphatase MutT (NUDIX family)